MAVNKLVIGTFGDDTLTGGTGNDTLLGSAGNDTLVVTSGSDYYDGGSGFDILDGSTSSQALTINLATGTMSGPGTSLVYNIEEVIGSGKSDNITGSWLSEVFYGGAGSDTISGGGGNDFIDGGTSSDKLDGGDGQDTVYGGDSNDVITGGQGDDKLYGDSGNDTIDGGDGNDLISGGLGNDSMRGGTGDDVISTDGGNDFIDGGDNNDRLYGGSGTDTINGGTGDDYIEGGDGGDTLHGNDGNDVIIAGSGADKVYGDSGNDRLVYDKTAAGGYTQTLEGGYGNDTLEVHLTRAQLTSAVQAELDKFQAFASNAANAGKTFKFTTLGNLQVTNVEKLSVVVDDANAPPVIDGSQTTASLIVAHNGTAAGQVVAADVNGDALTYSVSTAAQHGTVTVNGTNGHYTYTAGDYVGSDSFTIQVSDGHGGTTTQTVNVGLTNAGPAIDAGSTNTSLSVAHGQTVTGQVAATDADGDSVTYSVSTAAQHGTVTFTDANGRYTYAAGDYVGSDSFTIQVSDGHGGTTTQTVNVGVTNTGPAIDAGNTTASLSVTHGQTVTGQVAATDADGDSVTYSVSTAAQHGTVTFTDVNGHYTYTAGDYVGSDSFTIEVSDGHGGTTTQTINVGLTNAGPAIDAGSTNTSLSVAHGQTVTGQVAATDADGDSITYSVSTAAQHGTVTFTDANGHYTYAAGDYVGSDSFTIEVSDGHGGTTTQTVNVGLTNAGPAIDAGSTNTSLSVAHGQTVTGQVAATDADGDSVTYSVSTAAQHGTVTFTDVNGHYTYTAGDYVGSDSFTIEVSDGHGGTTTQTINVGLTNAGPAIDAGASTTTFDVAHGQAYAGQVVTTDADGDALTYTVVGEPQHGTVTFTGTGGNWVFQADGAFDTDSFTIEVSDGHGGVSTLTVAVTDPNTAPEIDPASDTTLAVAHNHTVSGTVAATDAESDALTFSLAAGPTHGTVTFTDAQGHYTYTAGDYLGSDSFTIEVADGYSGLTAHTVTVDVGNTGPVIDTALTTQSLIARGVQPMGGVLVATDADGDILTYSVSGAQHGTVTLADASGGYSYLSDGLAGTDSFTVSASDGHGGLVDQIVSVTTVGKLVAAQAATSAMTVDLSAHTATNAAGDVNYAVDVTGSALADRITGDAAANVLSGGLGNDTIAGGEGADTLDGGDGNDALNGGGGTDAIYGGNGNDGIYGGGANDAIYGNDGNDRVFGDGGNDVIFGGAGNDTMTGGQSNGLGGDFADTFGWMRSDVVNANGTSAGLDHITDFGVTDRLDFTGLFNNTHPADIASLVHVVDTSAGTVVSADVGGGHFMDVVVLDNVHNLTVDDLLHNHQVVV